MKRFRFGLERVAHVRETQMKSEEAKLEQLRSGRRAIEAERRDLQEAILKEEQRVRSMPQVSSVDIDALRGFSESVRRSEPRFVQRLAAQDHLIAQQQAVVIECRTRVRLLELLEQKRRSEWKVEEGREQDALASDFAAAQWSRQRDRG